MLVSTEASVGPSHSALVSWEHMSSSPGSARLYHLGEELVIDNVGNVTLTLIK